MYCLEFTEHFEDWYVADSIIGEFVSIDEAVVAFVAARKDILEMKHLAAGIEECITENFERNEDDEDISDYSKGFILKIRQGDDEILSQHFIYDHISQSINESYIDEFKKELYPVELINMLENTGC